MDDVLCDAIVDVNNDGIGPLVVVAVAVVQTESLHGVQLHLGKGHRPGQVLKKIDASSRETSYAGVVEIVSGAEDVCNFSVDHARHGKDACIME